MSKLDELIKKLCPDGVEYKKVKDVFIRIKGTPITATKMKEIETPDGEIRIFAGGKTVINAKEKDIPNANITRVPAVLVQSRGVIDAVYYDKPFTFKNEMWAYTHENKLTVKFLYYVLKNNVHTFREAASGMGSLPQISLTVTEDFLIPVPPLPVQEEIVRILDKFTTLTAELTAELTARRKQYEYYRDSLLTRDTKVEVKKLGDFATITRGGNFQKKDFVESGLPCIHYGQMYTHFGTWTDKTLTYVDKTVFDKSKQAQPNDIVMAVTSENVDDICKCTAWVGKEPIAVSGHTAIIHHNQNAKYLSYYFQSSGFYKQKVKLAHGTKVIEVTPDKLNDITIPIPPLDVQQRIVDILDNFDSICTDLKIGLPAEIEARKKQYEYYRDLLLTFASSGNTILTEQNRTEQNRTEQNR